MAVTVFEDRLEKGDWRVEYFDDDGTCYLTLFAASEPVPIMRPSQVAR